MRYSELNTEEIFNYIVNNNRQYVYESAFIYTKIFHVRICVDTLSF